MPNSTTPGGPGASPRPPWQNAVRQHLEDVWVRTRKGHWPLLVVGLLLVGSALTYLVAPPTTSEQVVAFTPDEVMDQERAVMPSIVGLNLETAKLVLSDQGLADVEVVTTTQAAAGAPGRVVTQSPDVGARATGTITLTVSGPVDMPDVTGGDYLAARATLEQLGAVVRISSVVRPGSTAGTVLSSSPAAGATVPAVVELSVADPGEAVALADISSQDSDGCDEVSSTMIGGTEVPDGISCEVRDPGSFVEHRLGKNALMLVFSAGFEDGTDGAAATVVVFGDGKELKRVEVAPGAPEVQVDVGGVETLRLAVVGTASDDPPRLILGSARLLGTPEGIAAITAGD